MFVELYQQQSVLAPAAFVSGFFILIVCFGKLQVRSQSRLHWLLLKGYSIIGSGSGFKVNIGSDSLVKSNDLGVSNVSRIRFGFGFIVNSDPDPIIE